MSYLRNMRRMAGMTQTKAARAAGICQARLSQAECGEIDLGPVEEARLRRALHRAIQRRAAKLSKLLEAPANSNSVSA
jgi:transcriptional regulator with XRE-family HTH domain